MSDKQLFWYQKPLRILQTVLREIDAENYDAASVVDYMKKAGCNALVVNGGGIFDFFQSSLEYAAPVPQLGKFDVLKAISEACRAAGFRTIVRIDFRGVTKDRWEKHPDWFAVDESGRPLINAAQSLSLCAPCYEGYYRNEYAERFLNYLLSSYPIDGIWHNAVLFHNVCHCPRCKESYSKFGGGDIPVIGKASDEEFKKYYAWKAGSARRNLSFLRSVVKSHGEDVVYTAEVFSMWDVKRPIETGMDLYEAKDFFDFLVTVGFLTENTLEPKFASLAYPSSITRFLRALDKSKQPVILFGGNGTSHRYVMDPPQDVRTWLWQGVAAGASFWNCYFNGRNPAATHDRRNAYIERDAYEYIRVNEEAYRTAVPVRDVALFYSKPTKDMHGKDDPREDEYCTPVQGTERVLLENHIQYGYVADSTFCADDLKDVKVLALPNVACLSDESCRIIRDWVASGGKLLATYKTSLYTETGSQRPDFALADLFGVSYGGKEEDTRKDCFQYIAERNSPLLRNVGDTDMIIANGKTLIVRAEGENSETALLHVPAINNQPPERAWRKIIPGDSPTAVVTRCGKGSVVYLANQTDKYCFVNGHPDFHLIMRNALLFLLNGAETLTADAPAGLNVSLLESESVPGAMLLSLVNTVSLPYRPLGSLIEIERATVRIRLKDASVDYAVGSGTGNQISAAVEKTGTDSWLKIVVQNIGEFAGVRIEPKK